MGNKKGMGLFGVRMKVVLHQHEGETENVVEERDGNIERSENKEEQRKCTRIVKGKMRDIEKSQEVEIRIERRM